MAGEKWTDLGAQGDRIQAVVGDAGREFEAALVAGKQHLEDELPFPFQAQIRAIQGNGPLQVGDTVTVTGIADMGEWYGIIVMMRHRYGLSPFPLVDLRVLDPESAAARPVTDYQAWFARSKAS